MAEPVQTTQREDEHAVVRAVAASKDPARQAQILFEHLRELEAPAAAAFLRRLLDASAADLACAKALLPLLDHAALLRHLGRDGAERLVRACRAEAQYEGLSTLLDRAAKIDRDELDAVKAKVAVLLQMLYLLRDRAQEEGIPQTSYDAVRAVVDVTDQAAQGPDMRHVLRVDLGRFGSGYRHILLELLKEADFRATGDDETYELFLSEPVIRQYATGSGLVSMETGETQTRMSDAVVARMGENLVKRLSLLARTVSMYPADHPGLGPMLEALEESLDRLMVEREQVTLSRLGTDILIEDIRIKRKTKALADFAAEMEERQLNSITFRRPTSVEEMRAFVQLFARPAAQIRKQGGVKAILEKEGIGHILVDQFKYGIIADGGAPIEIATPGGDKAVETAVLAEVAARLRRGQGLGDISSEELGAALKQILSAGPGGDRGVRHTLIQLLVALDPELMERAVFEKGIVSEELSWSSARKMVDQFLADLDAPRVEIRRAAVTSLGQLAEVAIQRGKETTLSIIVERLSERLWVHEKDLDVCQRMFEVLADLLRHLIVQGDYARALGIARLFRRFVDYAVNLPPDRQDLASRAMAEMAGRATAQVPEEAVVTALTNELAGPDTKGQDLAARILQLLPDDRTVEGLLHLFLDDRRSVRNRAFTTLSNMGERALNVCAEKVRNLNDATLFPRDRGTGTLSDHAWYIARNCIDLVARIGGREQVDLLRQAADDPDWRIRREALGELVKLDSKEAMFLARLKLGDREPEVVEAAIHALGSVQAREHVDDLIEVLFVDRRHRLAVVQALAKVGGEKAESVLLPALRFRERTPAARMYAEDFQLRLAAVRALAQAGAERTVEECSRFLAVWRNPLTRLLRFPPRPIVDHRQILSAVSDTLSRVQYRLQSRRTEPGTAARPT